MTPEQKRLLGSARSLFYTVQTENNHPPILAPQLLQNLEPDDNSAPHCEQNSLPLASIFAPQLLQNLDPAGT